MLNQKEKPLQASHLSMGKKILHELGTAKGKVTHEKKRYHQRCKDANARLKVIQVPYSALEDQTGFESHPQLEEIQQLSLSCVRTINRYRGADASFGGCGTKCCLLHKITPADLADLFCAGKGARNVPRGN